MNVLVACEESQRVCLAFRDLGHEAYSCDIQEPSGGHPEFHILGDVLQFLNPFHNGIRFVTLDGNYHYISRWDLIIAHPPCTYLSNAGNAYLSLPGRHEKTLSAFDFFMKFVNADCDFICIENPAGYANSHYRPADQTIHPYFFCSSPDDLENYQLKRTCLWLKNLPPLFYSVPLLPPPPPYSITLRSDGSVKNRYFVESTHSSKIRSKTFPAVAAAMASQWSNLSLQLSLF